MQSETGSGKTLSFLVPMLSVLDYPPKLFLDDLQGPQARARARRGRLQHQPGACNTAGRGERAVAGEGAQRVHLLPLPVLLLRGRAQAVVVVPTMELGVQCALTVYKLLGGNLSQRRPGDAANMFTFTGPRNIKASARETPSDRALVRSGAAPSSRCLMTPLPCKRCRLQVRGVLNKEEVAMAKGTEYLKVRTPCRTRVLHL